MKTFKHLLICGLILATMLLCFAAPKPKYTGTMILKNLHIPVTLKDWRSQDFSQAIKKTKDDRFNFLSDVFARIYGNRQGQSLLFLALDAGNFHHPRLCYGGSGFKSKDLADTEIHTPTGTLKAKTFLAQKGQESFVVLYWMCINQQPVDWTEQKFTQFWHSLFNKKQVGVMIRVDIPLPSGMDDDMTKAQAAIELGQQFLKDLFTALPADEAPWMVGK